jgi:hypothetical protein
VESEKHSVPSLDSNSSNYTNKCKPYFSLEPSRTNGTFPPGKHNTIPKKDITSLLGNYPSATNQQTKKAA